MNHPMSGWKATPSCEVCGAIVEDGCMERHLRWHRTLSNLPPMKITGHPYQRLLAPTCHQCGQPREMHATEYIGSNGPFSEPDIVPIEELKDSEIANSTIVHDPACAVALNPGLASAWMFCHCRPSMLGED